MKVGDAEVEYLGHSGFLIVFEINGNLKKIAIDPYNVNSNIGKVDYVLITHGHYDHCSVKDITLLSKHGTIVLITADTQSKITKIDGVDLQVIEAGEGLSFGNIKIEAVSAYNIDKKFHPKSDGWVGYVIKFANTIIYHAGDTDNIPEMQRLSGYGKQGNTFIILLPVSGTYVMTAEEAAEAASLLNPSVAIPMHYGAGVAGTLKDAEDFVSLCKEKGINAKILEKI